ncbi:thioredoxin family protein [Streptomyces sp. NPDC058052]|uniref:thioredoxin family protein n=1 Tax=Streptomyces sp. NPDC058052 TaxID=3346316 RepID=UPI0036E4339D
MAAHRRRQRTAGIQGLFRFSAVSLTVAAAAVATAHGGPKDERVDLASTAVAPDSPPDRDTSVAPPTGAPTASASPTAAAQPVPPATRPSPTATSPTARRTTALRTSPRPARTTTAPRPVRPTAPAAPTAPASKGKQEKQKEQEKSRSARGSSGFTTGYPTGVDARAAVASAVAAAKADGKKVLIDFGANWCGNCRAADEVLATSGIGALLDASYHVVKVDIGGQDSAAYSLLGRYASGEGAYKMPVLVVLDGNGGVVTETHSTGNPELTDAGLGAFLRKWA